MSEWIPEDVGGVRPQGTPGFWRRQFDDAPTRAQRNFDVAFGVVLPALCFAFDPIVFKGGMMGGGGLYQQYQFYAYSLSALGVAALCAWLFAAGRARLAKAYSELTLGGNIERRLAVLSD